MKLLTTLALALAVGCAGAPKPPAATARREPPGDENCGSYGCGQNGTRRSGTVDQLEPRVESATLPTDPSARPR